MHYDAQHYVGTFGVCDARELEILLRMTKSEYF